MKTKTEAAKILLEAEWNWDEIKEVLEEVKIVPNFDPYCDTYSCTDSGTYVNAWGETRPIPNMSESSKNYIDGMHRPISG